MKLTKTLSCLLAMVFFSSLPLTAQRTLTGYVGPLAEISTLDGDMILSAGGGGGIVLREVFFLGAFGMGQVNSVPKTVVVNDVEYVDQNISLGQFGVWIGYISNPYNSVRWMGSMKVGFGGISFMADADEKLQNYIDSFTAFTPQFDLEFVPARFLKVSVGAGYRLAIGANQDPFTNGQLSSPVGHVGLYFGGILE